MEEPRITTDLKFLEENLVENFIAVWEYGGNIWCDNLSYADGELQRWTDVMDDWEPCKLEDQAIGNGRAVNAFYIY